MLAIWVVSTMVVVSALLVIALDKSLRVGPVTAVASMFSAGALIAGLQHGRPESWVVAVTVCAAIAAADQLHRRARGKTDHAQQRRAPATNDQQLE